MSELQRIFDRLDDLEKRVASLSADALIKETTITQYTPDKYYVAVYRDIPYTLRFYVHNSITYYMFADIWTHNNLGVKFTADAAIRDTAILGAKVYDFDSPCDALQYVLACIG